MLQQAFKEWAVICKALAEGKQALVIRKGGIAEEHGRFTVKHDRFWLYPTYLHQQREGIKETAGSLLDQAASERPPEGTVRLDHFVDVQGIYRVESLTRALLIDHLHCWSEETINKRFEYRTPGLYVLSVRAYRAADTFEIPETDAYAGCKSWVELDEALSTDAATPVLSDETFRDFHFNLEMILNPTMLA